MDYGLLEWLKTPGMNSDAASAVVIEISLPDSVHSAENEHVELIVLMTNLLEDVSVKIKLQQKSTKNTAPRKW
jgi:hypothetical protein